MADLIIYLVGSNTPSSRSFRSFVDDLPSVFIPSEAFMDESAVFPQLSRRNEDIALDMMKFIAMTTGYGKTLAGAGFERGGTASKPEEYAGHLLELYGRCLAAVQGKK
jgi:hypothetical protein